MSRMMKAAIFVEPNRIVIGDKPIPDAGPLGAFAAAKRDDIEAAYELFANQPGGVLKVAITA